MTRSTESPSPHPGHGSAARGLRPRIERLSSPPLASLVRLPVWLPFLVVLALMLVGIFVGGPLGAVLLAVPVIFLCWLLYLTWPRLGTAERAMRLAVLALVLAIAVTQVVPQ